MVEGLTDTPEPDSVIVRLQVTGPLDRAGIEAFQLELRRLLRARGVEAAIVRLEQVRAQ
jgi:hypothetical protein